MYAEGMKLAKRLEEEEAALKAELQVGGAAARQGSCVWLSFCMEEGLRSRRGCELRGLLRHGLCACAVVAVCPPEGGLRSRQSCTA